MSENNKGITMGGRGSIKPRDDQMVATVDKDAFRAMFYMFAGKPDSKHQTFNGDVIVGPNDIFDLNNAVNEKFRHHDITESITTISISLDKNKTLDFGTWAEFQAQDWKQAESVKDISVKWDFLIKLKDYAQPQRHVLSVNFIGDVSPAAMLKIVVGSVGAPQDLDISNMFGGCMARVDFINHSLADELLALVGRWHEALHKSPTDGTFLALCEKNDELIADCVSYSLPISAAVVSFFALDYVANQFPLESVVVIGALKLFCYWILGTIIAFWSASHIAKYVAKRTYRAITSYGAYHTFRFTRGDDNIVSDLTKRNKSLARHFFLSILSAVSLNVIAGLVVVWFIGKQ